jgi:predicted dehydrogenase
MRQDEGRVRYAVIGAGYIAQAAVLPAFAHAKENSELVALVSSNREKRAELAKKYDIEDTGSYDELEKVLEESRADAVWITVPNTLHRAFTERAARARTHVICEKPMAMTPEDCRAMIDVAEENVVRLMIAYRLHFEEANLSAIETALSGQIGEPRFFGSEFAHVVRPDDIRWRANLGGGALFDLGTYCVNAARCLFRAEPTEVSGFEVMGRNGHPSDVDEVTTALLAFSDGRTAQFTVSQDAADISTYRLVGTRGDLCVDSAYEYTTAIEHRLTLEGGRVRRRRFKKRDQFAAELVYFSECIRSGIQPEPDGWEGLADVRVMTAIRNSARTGRSILLPPFARKARPTLEQSIKKPPQHEPELVQASPPSLH